MSGRESAHAAYIAWLNGCTNLLPPEDDDAVRSEAGWLAYLAGYLQAEQTAAEQVAELRTAVEMSIRSLSNLLDLHALPRSFDSECERILDSLRDALAATKGQP